MIISKGRKVIQDEIMKSFNISKNKTPPHTHTNTNTKLEMVLQVSVDHVAQAWITPPIQQTKYPAYSYNSGNK